MVCFLVPKTISKLIIIFNQYTRVQNRYSGSC